MAAAARVQGVLIPPGTATVILAFDGPVDVPALHNALGRMIADGDMLGLPIGPLEPPPRTLATGGILDRPIAGIGEDDGCVLQVPHFDGPTSREAFEEATRGFHERALEVQARIGERMAPAFVAAAAAMSSLEDAHDYGSRTAAATVRVIDERAAPATPLEHLRAYGPTTAAQLAAALGITRQKAVIELGELVRTGKAAKGDNKTYKAVAREL